MTEECGVDEKKSATKVWDLRQVNLQAPLSGNYKVKSQLDDVYWTVTQEATD